MQEFTAPGAVEGAASDNVVAALFDAERLEPHRAALAHRRGEAFVDVSVAEFAGTVRELAAGLIGLGVQPGDRVCLFMPTCIEFTYLDYAIWAAGATTVTIYETSSTDQVEWIMADSGSRVLFCGSPEMRGRFDEAADRLPACRHAFTVDDGGLDDLRRAAADVDAGAVEQRCAAVSHDDLATLVYTSGTTGRPKGCKVTHGNLIWEVRQVVEMMDHLFVAGGSTLMFLPLAHILARVVQVGCVTRGVKLGYGTGIAHLVPELGDFRPTWLFAVPRVFEKVYNAAQASAGRGLQRRIFDRAADVAIRWSQETIAGDVGRLTAVEHAVFDRLVYAKLRNVLGGQVRLAISGGAPLGERLGHFFHGVGVLVLEGYGLTETTAAATVNTVEHFRIGTVGRPIPGSSVRIAEDGEILLRGGMVFAGYWSNEAATAAVLDDDGWLSTGDLGALDDDGFLRITGRKKELIVTAAGKNVAPAVLEEAVRAHPLVSHAVVLGDQRPFIAALVTLDVEEVAKWAEAVGAQASAPGELIRELVEDRSGQLHREIQTAVDRANQQVSRAESIREFRILTTDFTVESGELTPTMKLKRSVVFERHRDAVADIYGA